MKAQHPKQNPDARCCWICGKVGGAGFTTALRWLGYDVKPGEMAYAHSRCVLREQRKVGDARAAEIRKHVGGSRVVFDRETVEHASRETESAT